MSADLGPGTPLIFVGPDDPESPSGLTKDALYFVDDVVPNFFCEAPLVSLKGAPGNYTWFCVCRFKPLIDGEPVNDDEQVSEYA